MPIADLNTNPTQSFSPAPEAGRLRLLSYNVQAGIASRHYGHYVTHSWKHILPFPQRLATLDRIAALIHDYDIVALQEVDGGSLRSNFINLTEYLARHGGFPHWYDRTNRNLGGIAQHSLGLLSRLRPRQVEEYSLPGAIPGRGVLVSRYGEADEPLVVVAMHLALGRRARERQLGYVAELIGHYRHVIVMGDLNCHGDSREVAELVRRTSLREPIHDSPTFPSWRPAKTLDHILVSESVEVVKTHVPAWPYSDHLPVAMEVRLPHRIRLDHTKGAPEFPRAALAAAL